MFNSPLLIGLDIRPYQVCMMALFKKRGGWVVDAIAHTAIPDALNEKGEIVNWDQVGLILNQIVENKKLKGKWVAIHLPSTMTRFQRLLLPKGVSKAHIKHQINLHIKRDFSEGRSEICVDFALLQNELQTEVVWVAAKKAYLLRYKTLIEQVGLRLSLIDVDIYAMARVIHFYLLKTKALQKLNQVLIVLEDQLVFMIFNHETILCHDRANACEKKEFLKIISRHQQSFENLSVLLLASDDHQFLNELEKEFEIKTLDIDLFSSMTFNKNTFISHHPISFLTAAGLAMRESL